jgi:hypothetical protein
VISTLPRLGNVDDLANLLGLSQHEAYEAAKLLPAGVRVQIGRRLRIDLDRLREWLAQGGTLAGRRA